ncbi:unnamed protein product [Paramecium pentaurelia]|uniref:Sulfide:quinone oxidoreductase, mitochondrial n=1 Tax=Paramecium pentaurelia TaxID=43138 RepID=A0A8S1X237_9CILI|nr:unnamed protein product [Paramecium pentaurelia]
MQKINCFRGFTFSAIKIHSQIAIIGGGTAGLNIAAQLIGDGHAIPQQIRIFEPSKMHAYQPGWTMVGGGLCNVKKTLKPMEQVLPKNISVSDSAVTKINPQKNEIETQDGGIYTYDQLVIATGIQTNFDQIKGAQKYLDDLNSPVASIYNYKYAVKMNRLVEEFEGGNILYTEPPLPIKCAGAPQKIIYLSHDRLNKRGIKTHHHFYKTAGVIFGVPKYAEILTELCKNKQINCHFKQKLVEVQDHIAIFENQDTKELKSVTFDLLHLVPPQFPAQFIAQSGLGDSAGFAHVHPNTLQHVTYKNIWSLGDCSSLPTSKTAAAVMAQTPVLVKNLIRTWKYKLDPIPGYLGYTSCPIFTSQTKLLLAEFKYNSELDETFPIFQSNESRLMFHLKKDFFPIAYWQIMVRGLWGGRDGLRFFKGA